MFQFQAQIVREESDDSGHTDMSSEVVTVAAESIEAATAQLESEGWEVVEITAALRLV